MGLGEPSQGLVPGVRLPRMDQSGASGAQMHKRAIQGSCRRLVARSSGLPALLPQSLEEEPGAGERKAVDQGGRKFRSERDRVEARGLKPEHSELPQLDPQPAPPT